MPNLILVPKEKPAIDRGGRPAVISREKVLEAARQLSSHELSMNTVAKRLGVQRASLYYHFRSRQDLLAALAANFISELHIPDPDPVQWKRWLQKAITSLYELLNTHPVFLQLENFSQIFRAGILLQESALETLVGAGFRVDDAARVWRLLTSHAYMTASNAHQARDLDTAKLTKEALQLLADAEQVQPMPFMRALLQKKPEDPQQRFATDLAWHIQLLPEPNPPNPSREIPR